MRGQVGMSMGRKLDFAAQVRLMRVLLNVRQFHLADAMGVSPVTMCRWEAGAQIPHRTTQSLFFIMAKRNGIAFDERGYPSRIAGTANKFIAGNLLLADTDCRNRSGEPQGLKHFRG